MNDLGALIENNFLAFIRTSAIFFVASVALFHFTEYGKMFSLVSLSIALILTISVVVDYFQERNRINKLGFKTRTIIDILAYLMVGMIIFILFIIGAVYFTDPTRSPVINILDTDINIATDKITQAIKESRKSNILRSRKNALLSTVV
jgi:uncharacterized membrane protein YidH (DUF202 family)